MGKSAAIYVRTSSEHQGEKASPQEQERDCRQLADEHDLTVVEVYRDVKNYRSRGKLVTPSGSRADRPGLLAMLEDAEAGRFDVILAWREDRLYRGYRPMLNVLEVVQEHELDIMLAREQFDAKMTPIKVWAAQQEIEALKERMTMGVKERLRAGKANTGQDRFGYERDGDVIRLVEEEAYWVRKIFEWYIDKVPIMEIRERLIAAGVEQKGSSRRRKVKWSRNVIQGILQSADVYYTGVKTHTRDGEEFEIPVPPIIDGATYRAFKKRREANKTYPARNVKHDYLIGGMLYCKCPRSWRGRTHRKRYKSGKLLVYGSYYCTQRHESAIHPDCPRTIGSKKADNYVWDRVVEVLGDPDILIASARQRVDELRAGAEQTAAERQRIQSGFDALDLERQEVIRLRRKGQITDKDLDRQLGELEMQELYLKGEMSDLDRTNEALQLENWEGVVREFLNDLRAGLRALDVTANDDETKKEQIDLKRRTVQALVDKVIIGADRQMTVLFKLDLLELLSAHLESEPVQNKLVGTCTHK